MRDASTIELGTGLTSRRLRRTGLAAVVATGLALLAVGAERPDCPVVMMRFSAAQTRSMAEWKETAKAFADNPGCCDEVWFSTGESFPSVDWHRRHLVCLREAAKDMRNLGIGVSLQFETTIGHGDDFPTAEEKAVFDKPWTGWTGRNGTECRYCSCPRQPEFLRRLVEVSELYATIRPAVVWIDDDLRITRHRPASVAEDDAGCWCARCVADFAAQDGRPWTREAMLQAWGRDAGLRDRWYDFSSRSMAEVACAISKAFRTVSPDTRIGLQTAVDREHFNRIVLRALEAATGVKSRVRLGGGYYYDLAPFVQIAKSRKMVATRQLWQLEDVVENWCTEVETYPRAYGSRSVRSIALEAFSALGWGLDTVSVFALDRRSETDAFYSRYLLRPLVSVTKFLNDYCRANVGSVPAGFSCPIAFDDARQLMGLPLLPGAGRVWGEISAEREVFPSIGAVWGEFNPRMMPKFEQTPSAKLQVVRDSVSGTAPLKMASPFVGVVLPRVTEDGSLHTVGLIGTRLDPQEDIVLLVDTPVERVLWHELGTEPRELKVETAAGGRRKVTVPSLGAWNAGYVDFCP